VVVISHNLADVFAVADRIVVLRLGKQAAALMPATVTQERVVAAITGADLVDREDQRHAGRQPMTTTAGSATQPAPAAPKLPRPKLDFLRRFAQGDLGRCG